ncbi:hypothetical protein H9X81_08760 [Hydrogenoanaerobacterium saccharovorans]|uniref:Uncharacterized protein n=1 Tax=Hydrogenoanaerobacterium saccharovorans TaxID=474960 RepID=A0ABS2GMS4_9FIRM|nr:hypothetical protein [Hydrogenoanaerobacterium saccharovorans]MBM6923775.1 hypothetical protein [Hydrogenoanaerobacterium saccharovorans]
MNESYELPCKKYGVNWANSVVCDGKMNNNLRFYASKEKQKQYENIEFFCGGV